MLWQLFERLALGLLVLLYRVYKFVRERIVRALGDNRAASGRQGLQTGKPSWQRAAIVAVNSDPYAASLFANLLNGFCDNDFFVVAVVPGKSAAGFRDSIQAHCHYLLEKPFSGYADSYKAGRDWIQNCGELKNIETLALANDGLFYPRYIASTIGQMLGRQDGWQQLFENMPSSRHAQDFFQLFRAPVFTSDAFISFWRNQTLPAARLPAVTMDKTDLTDALLNAGFAPRAYYNGARLREDVSAALANEDIPAGLHDALNLTLGFGRVNRRVSWTKDSLSLPVAEALQRIDTLTKKNDPVYAVGLLCNFLYQAPLKRDICDYGRYAKDDVVALAQGFSAGEKEALMKDLQRRSSAAGRDGFYKFPQRLVRIAGRSF